jgi:hypothetical protein
MATMSAGRTSASTGSRGASGKKTSPTSASKGGPSTAFWMMRGQQSRCYWMRASLRCRAAIVGHARMVLWG